MANFKESVILTKWCIDKICGNRVELMKEGMKYLPSRFQGNTVLNGAIAYCADTVIQFGMTEGGYKIDSIIWKGNDFRDKYKRFLDIFSKLCVNPPDGTDIKFASSYLMTLLRADIDWEKLCIDAITLVLVYNILQENHEKVQDILKRGANYTAFRDVTIDKYKLMIKALTDYYNKIDELGKSIIKANEELLASLE